LRDEKTSSHHPSPRVRLVDFWGSPAQEASAPPPEVPAPFHPLTLSFRDKALESAFLCDHAVHSLSIVRLSLFFAAVLYVLYSWLDFQFVPARAETLLLFRSAGAVFLLGVAAFS